jgi:hypothetical protein
LELLDKLLMMLLLNLMGYEYHWYPHAVHCHRTERELLPPVVFLQHPLLTKHSVTTAGKEESSSFHLIYHKAGQ